MKISDSIPPALYATTRCPWVVIGLQPVGFCLTRLSARRNGLEAWPPGLLVFLFGAVRGRESRQRIKRIKTNYSTGHCIDTPPGDSLGLTRSDPVFDQFGFPAFPSSVRKSLRSLRLGERPSSLVSGQASPGHGSCDIRAIWIYTQASCFGKNHQVHVFHRVRAQQCLIGSGPESLSRRSKALASGRQ